MATVQCAQCGFISPIASELCAQCGLELPRRSYSPAQSDDYNPRYTTELPPPPFGAPRTGPVLFGLTKPIEPFVSVGNVIETTLSLFVKNWWLITKLVFVIFAPFEVFRTLSIGTNQKNFQLAVGGVFLMLVCKALIAPSLIFSLMTIMRTGTAPTLTDAYRWGLSRLPKLALCAVMVWFLTALGFVMLIIPGIILSVAFQLVYPMASLEDRSATEILKRSYDLTKGNRWNIFGAMFCIGLISGLVNIPASILVGILTFQGINAWPLQAAVAVLVDIIGEMTTVASLVIYISILSSHPPEGAFEN